MEIDLKKKKRMVGSGHKELPSSIHHLREVDDLFVENCAIKELASSIGHLTKLMS